MSVHENILNEIPSEYSKNEGESIWDITKAVSIELEEQDSKIDDLKSKFSIDNLDGTELEERVNARTGIQRKQATFATTTVLVTGTNGSQINKGDKVASDSVNFLFDEDKVIDGTGQSIVNVICEVSGTNGNVPVGAIKYFPVTISGLNTVTNTEAVTSGYNAETDLELLTRYYERMRTPSTSGNKMQYKNWAKEVTGVGDAKVFPLWNGDNTVKVVLIDSNKSGASTELITEVQNYIDPSSSGLGEGQAPIGAKCTVVSANEVQINITFTAVKDGTVSDSERQQAVEDDINEYIGEVAFVDNILRYNKIGSIILDTKGIIDYSDLMVNGLQDNIVLNDDDVPVLGGVTIA